MLQSAAIWNHPNFVSYENGYASLNWIDHFASQILVAIHIKVEKVIWQNRTHFVQNRLVSFLPRCLHIFPSLLNVHLTNTTKSTKLCTSFLLKDIIRLKCLSKLRSNLRLLLLRLLQRLPIIPHILRFKQRADGLMEELHLRPPLLHHIPESLRYFLLSPHFCVKIIVFSSKILQFLPLFMEFQKSPLPEYLGNGSRAGSPLRPTRFSPRFLGCYGNSKNTLGIVDRHNLQMAVQRIASSEVPLPDKHAFPLGAEHSAHHLPSRKHDFTSAFLYFSISSTASFGSCSVLCR